MRSLALVALVVLVAGCRSSESSGTHGSLTLGENEIRAAGDALSAKLAGLDVKDLPTLRVVAVKNETGRKLRLDLLEDEARRRTVECNKFAVSTDPERKPEYVLLTTITDDNDGINVTFEILQLASKHRILLATRRFSVDTN